MEIEIKLPDGTPSVWKPTNATTWRVVFWRLTTWTRKISSARPSIFRESTPPRALCGRLFEGSINLKRTSPSSAAAPSREMSRWHGSGKSKSYRGFLRRTALSASIFWTRRSAFWVSGCREESTAFGIINPWRHWMSSWRRKVFGLMLWNVMWQIFQRGIVEKIRAPS